MNTTYTVPDGVRQLRADKALSLSHPDHSRVAFRRAFDAGLVTLRGKVIVPDTPVVGGDVLEFSFPALKPAELKAVDIPLDVIFEDKHLLAINKTSGMIVHPGAGTGEDTLVHALLAHCKGGLSGIGGVEQPGSRTPSSTAKRRASSSSQKPTPRIAGCRSSFPNGRCKRNISRSWRARPRS